MIVLIMRGGLLMIPLGLCAVLATFSMLERCI